MEGIINLFILLLISFLFNISIKIRIKPDIMAPGWATYSVKSHGETFYSEKTCEAVTKSGTSMAAPTAAGLLYFFTIIILFTFY